MNCHTFDGTAVLLCTVLCHLDSFISSQGLSRTLVTTFTANSLVSMGFAWFKSFKTIRTTHYLPSSSDHSQPWLENCHQLLVIVTDYFTFGLNLLFHCPFHMAASSRLTQIPQNNTFLYQIIGRHPLFQRWLCFVFSWALPFLIICLSPFQQASSLFWNVLLLSFSSMFRTVMDCLHGS